MFSGKVSTDLKFYVYRLIDPRNGETFYVGKGKGNRVFEHVNAAINIKNVDDELCLKNKRILDIKNIGLEVIYVIHRHGLDENTAIEIEAALIDCYPGLTNIQGGHNSFDRGPMSPQQIINKYALPELQDSDDKLLLININMVENKTSKYSILKQTQWCWRLDVNRARKADYVLSVERGVVIGAFKPTTWDKAIVSNFPKFDHFEDDPNRYAFDGDVASEDIWNKYVGTHGKRITNDGMRHVQNPIRYWNI